MSPLAVARVPRAALLAGLFRILMSCLALEPCSAVPGDAERGDLLVRQAIRLLDTGLPGEARGYAERALEFAGDSADARALLGRVEQAEGRHDRAAAELALALKIGAFRLVREAETRKVLAASLVRMRRNQDAFDTLRGIEPEEVDEEALLLLVRAELALGSPEDARRLALEATQRYPDSTVAYLLRAAAERSLNRFGDARRTLETARARLPSDPAILLALLEHEVPGAGRPALLSAYFALANRSTVADAAAAVVGLRSDPEQAGSYLERFLASDGMVSVERLAEVRALLAGSADLEAQLDRALAAWSGERFSDADGDSYPEYRYRFSAGTLQEWGADPDQDGLEEAVVLTGSDGEPREATVRGWAEEASAERETALVVALGYARYPWVASVTFSQTARRREYELVPSAYRFRLFDAAYPAEPPRLAEGFAPPAEAAVRRAASSYRDVELPQGLVAARGLLLGGQILRLEADADGDGHQDHVVLYRGGLPSSGTRDLDNDGVFETREVYEAGLLARIEVDADGDGKAEYSRDYGERGREQWDLDADGVMDVERSREILEELRGLYSGPAEGESR